ncbi:hypothetical protein APHAL10511_005758 [Amanita phalloides]|nr:hypothetical protein APHAL10511_005758 [Amanita phalloides]
MCDIKGHQSTYISLNLQKDCGGQTEVCKPDVGNTSGHKNRRQGKKTILPSQIQEIIDLTKELVEPEQPSIQDTQIQRHNLEELHLYEGNWDTFHLYKPSLGSHADGQFLKQLAKAAMCKESVEYGFVIIQPAEFRAKSPEEIQDILVDRSIVVKGMEHNGINFDRRGLERLGSLDAVRTIQGKMISINNDGHVLISDRPIN